MPIEGFDYQKFSQELAKEANNVIAQSIKEISDDDRQYIVTKIASFCNMAGEALAKGPNENLTVKEAATITQFIGEWTFHKAIDLIKGNMPQQLRDGILQKIAFVVFESAKTATTSKLPQNEMVELVENKVKQTFFSILKELQTKNIISSDQANSIANRSNLDDMAKQQSATASVSQDKLLKLVALGMVLRKMPQDKIITILKKFDQKDAEIIIDAIKRPNIEKNLDPSITMHLLEEISSTLPIHNKITSTKVNKELSKIINDSNKPIILELLSNERSNIKEFVFPSKGHQNVLPPQIGNVVCKYLKEKVK